MSFIKQRVFGEKWSCDKKVLRVHGEYKAKEYNKNMIISKIKVKLELKSVIRIVYQTESEIYHTPLYFHH